MSTDVDAARTFYRSLFGWELAIGGEETGGYTMALIDGRSVAGIGSVPPGSQMPTVWTTYLATTDVDATAKAITAAGGVVYQEPFDVMTFGRMAVAADPTGGMFGLWQAGEHWGAALANVPGSMTWNEILSRDYDAAKAFYTEVFGYTMTEMGDENFLYSTLEIDGNIVGGIGAMPAGAPAGVPSSWMVYFSVDDADATVEAATGLGASIIRAAQDSPYGRSATLSDPQGGIFTVIQNATPDPS
jgi:predicted enzyme related to lactoylglutathione lyase